ncbi:MAG TPA: T9SS type A sorting domain-containing protein [Candidatus Kapabacteria bacterium]|nr:T9SS type A sorting domain-containing protein [Candidatus Kapabacteria bacterium]
MKIHFFILAIIIVLYSSVSGRAQIVGTVSGVYGATLSNGLAASVNAPNPQPPFVANPSTISLSYYNDSLPVFDWIFPALYNPFAIGAFGERMTLPTDSGYVDSVAVRIDSAAGDSIIIALVPDTLFNVGGGRLFNLMNVFQTPFKFFFFKKIAVPSVRIDSFTVITTNHVKVSKDFFVFVAPNGIFTGDPPSGWSFKTSAILKLTGDVEPTRTRTTDNTRSAFIGVLQTGQVLSAILDSTFVIYSTNAIAFTNFYATAFVDTAGAAGVKDGITPSANIAISDYPNPFASSTQLKINTAGDHTSLKIYDALGRDVADLTSQLPHDNSSEVIFNAGNLPPGVYYARLQSGQTSVTKTLLLLK